jgi:starch phosphorylase
MRPLHRLTVRPALPASLAGLELLARNLRWTWHRPTRDLFRTIDREAWEASGCDPLRLLDTVAPERLQALADDPAFRGRLEALLNDLDRYGSEPRWFQGRDEGPQLVAYFSPEFGVTEVLPQYSGGLGVLAGDHLKAASDLGVPLVGVGLFYGSGYFRQSLAASGTQQEAYPALDPARLPMTPVRDEEGRDRLVSIDLPGMTLHARIWRVEVGRVPLLLLDANVPENTPDARAVTDRLYGGGSEHRLRQEILLGIGGVRALAVYGLEPDVFHMNEGHAGFLVFERVRRLVAETGVDAATALEQVRAATVFTTHTPVPAGIDRFPRELIERYFGPGGFDSGLGTAAITDLGAEPEGTGDVFNMAVLGLRSTQRANGVSRLHGAVSREMFQALWPGFEVDEVPIGHITNGVHGATWVNRDFAGLYERVLGEDYAEPGRSWDALRDVPDEDLWSVRRQARRRLVDEIRSRQRDVWLERGASRHQLGWIGRAFDPEALTIGFARRVPSYKRLTLILRDPERLRRLLTDPDQPLQMVVAGKAHPADEGGKELIRQFVEFASDPGVRHRIAFLPDYDMAMARFLVAGCDVWLNNPLRPYEACGTSGMKSALNGGLNLSILDGWWDELYDGRNGWAIPSADDGTLEADRRDEYEAKAIFDLLENEVVPMFYSRSDGLPRRWIGMVRHAVTTLGPAVQASRQVQDYVEALYTPAAAQVAALAADGGRTAGDLAAWKRRVRDGWPNVAVRDVSASEGRHRLGDRLEVRAVVGLGGLAPDDVAVEAIGGRVDEGDRLEGEARVRLEPMESADGNGTWEFAGELPLSTAGAFGYTVRVVPAHAALATSAELGLVRWADDRESASADVG